MSYRKQFLMTPGGKIFLKDLDPDFSDKKDDKKSACRKVKKLQQRMDALQFAIIARRAELSR